MESEHLEDSSAVAVGIAVTVLGALLLVLQYLFPPAMNTNAPLSPADRLWARKCDRIVEVIALLALVLVIWMRVALDLPKNELRSGLLLFGGFITVVALAYVVAFLQRGRGSVSLYYAYLEERTRISASVLAFCGKFLASIGPALLASYFFG